MSLTETGLRLTPTPLAVALARMAVTVSQAEKDEFAAKVKAWREAKSLSQSEAAKKLGIPVKTLQNWEISRRKPNATLTRFILAKMKV